MLLFKVLLLVLGLLLRENSEDALLVLLFAFLLVDNAAGFALA
jgi:hypothetical protein